MANKIKKTSEKASEKKVVSLSYKQMTRDLIHKGLLAETVKSKIVNRYVTEGKEEAWAKARANAIFSDVSKHLKKAPKAA